MGNLMMASIIAGFLFPIVLIRAIRKGNIIDYILSSVSMGVIVLTFIESIHW